MINNVLMGITISFIYITNTYIIYVHLLVNNYGNNICFIFRFCIMDDNEMNIATFVDFFNFELPGNVFNSAIALGDVDNDNEIELVIGSVEGDLFIFKGHRLIQKISGLGIITAIAIGDLMNCGSNALIVISGDGWCHIYLCLKFSKLDSSDECIMKLEPVHDQRIPANTKVNIENLLN